MNARLQALLTTFEHAGEPEPSDLSLRFGPTLHESHNVARRVEKWQAEVTTRSSNIDGQVKITEFVPRGSKVSCDQARKLSKQHDGASRYDRAAITDLATMRQLFTPSRSPVEIARQRASDHQNRVTCFVEARSCILAQG